MAGNDSSLGAEIAVGCVVTIVGTLVTLLVADGFCHQHWAFWPVLGAWALLVFVGVVLFDINDGDFDLF